MPASTSSSFRHRLLALADEHEASLARNAELQRVIRNHFKSGGSDPGAGLAKILAVCRRNHFWGPVDKSPSRPRDVDVEDVSESEADVDEFKLSRDECASPTSCAGEILTDQDGAPFPDVPRAPRGGSTSSSPAPAPGVPRASVDSSGSVLGVPAKSTSVESADEVPLERFQRFETSPAWTTSVSRMSNISDFSHNSHERIADHEVEKGRLVIFYEKHVVLDPGCSRATVWDFLGFLAIASDIITVPLQVFSPPAGGVVDAMMWLSQLYWNFDILKSFTTGYYLDGALIVHPALIFRRYLRTWFAFDISLVTLDWSIVLFYSQYLTDDNDKKNSDAAVAAPTARVAKGLRMLRYLRMVRMLRIAKFAQFMGLMNDMMSMDLSVVRFGMAKVVVALLLSTHLVACAWFALGMLDPDEVGACSTWIRAWNGLNLQEGPQCWELRHRETDLLQNFTVSPSEFGMRYTVSLLWATTQLGFGSFDRAQPQNWAENLFSIALEIFSLFIVSGIVGGITSSILRVLSSKADELSQFSMLRRFCRQRSVPPHLSSRIYRFAQDLYRERHGHLVVGSVDLLELLSGPLRAELHYYMYLEFFEFQPLFSTFCTNYTNTMHKVSFTALSIEVLASGDTVFVQRTLCCATRCIEEGVLQYRRKRRGGDAPVGAPSTALVAGKPEPLPLPPPRKADKGMRMLFPSEEAAGVAGGWEDVERGQWISGASLFTTWIHVGTLRALTDCRVVVIDVAKFTRAVVNDIQPWKVASDHGVDHVKRLNQMHKDDLTDIDERARKSQEAESSRHWWLRQSGGLTKSGDMGSTDSLRTLKGGSILTRKSSSSSACADE